MIIKSIGGRGLEPRFMFQMMTYHRLFLFFLFLVPAIPAVLGHFLLPLQLGARNLALPGLARWSLSFYAAGFVLVLLSIVFGPIATGWTMASLLSATDPGAFGLVALGLFCLAVSWFMIGVNIIVTVHDRRAPGMGFFDLPIFSWSLYLGAYQLVVTGAVFGIVILYLAAARVAGKGLFGPLPATRRDNGRCRSRAVHHPAGRRPGRVTRRRSADQRTPSPAPGGRAR